MYSCNHITTGITAHDMQAYYSFHQQLMIGLQKQPKAFEAFSQRTIELLQQPNRRECLLKKDGLVIGWLSAEAYESDNNRVLFALTGHLLQPVNNADFYTELKQLLSSWKNQLNAVDAFIRAGNIYEDNLRMFLQGTLLDEMRWFKLNVQNVNTNQLNQWVGNVDITGLKEVFSVYVPEEYMNQFVTGMNNGLRDTPTPMVAFTQYTNAKTEQQNVVDRKNGNRRHLVLLLLNSANELVAMSNVTLFSKPTTPARQWLTYVAPGYRGRGLAKYLKAKMMQHLLTGFTEIAVVEADCYAGNTPMIEINKQMGYIYTKSTFDYRVKI